MPLSNKGPLKSFKTIKKTPKVLIGENTVNSYKNANKIAYYDLLS